MEKPAFRQRQPDPGPPNDQTSPALHPRPSPPIPAPPSFWRRLSVIQWIILCIPLLAITVWAAENDQLQEAINAADLLSADEYRRIRPPIIAHRVKSSQDTWEPTVGSTEIVAEPTTGSTRRNPELAFDLCNTPECMNLSFSLLAKMNHKVEPCDDFYDHACGGLMKDPTIPYDKKFANPLTMANDRLQRKLRSLVGTLEVDADEFTPFKIAKYLYHECMDKAQIQRNDMHPLWTVFEKLGGWYLLKEEGWKEPDPYWTLIKSMKDLSLQFYVNDYFIDCSVGVDWRNTSRRTIYLDQPTLGMSRKTLIKGYRDPTVKAYFTTMVNSTVLLGAKENRAWRHLRESLHFEIQLANISLSDRRRQNASILYNPMKVQELQSTYPFINWLDYFRVVFNDTGIVIDENETVIVKAPGYFRQLGPLLQNTSSKALTNYVMWRIIRYTIPFLSKNLQELQLEYDPKLSAEQEIENTWKECVDLTTKHYPIAVGALYVRKYSNDEFKRAALEMVHELRNAFLDILYEASWTDEDARSTCLRKITSMAFNIGYPDELFDDRKLLEYYKPLEAKLWNEVWYHSSVLIIERYNRIQGLKMLRQPVNRTDWITHSNQATIDVHYSPIENSIQISTGLLQELLFPLSLPSYMNYGSIGYLIGREFTRVCDFQGLQPDRNETSDCFIDQYSNYTEPKVKLKLRGQNTLDENIADNVGLKVAYYAYEKWANWNRVEPALEGVHLPPKQMFWLSAAQTWCSACLPEAMKKHITTGSTSPDRFRVLGPMRNLDQFSGDFKCLPGSPMNPTKKCKAW